MNFGDDPAVLERLLAIKQDNKNQLCRLLWAEQSIALDHSLSLTSRSSGSMSTSGSR